MNKQLTSICSLATLALAGCSATQATPGATMPLTGHSASFVTEGNSVRNSVTASIDGQSALYISELDGGLSAYRLDGSKIWHQPTQTPAVMLEIVAADINGNGSDELLAASADGHIYAWSGKGQLLWKYSPGYKVRFAEVAVVGQGASAQIFAGANDHQLYEIDSKGQPVSKTPVEGVFRQLESGHFLSQERESLFIHTYARDKSGWKTMGIMDPISKKMVKTAPKERAFGKQLKMMVNDFEVADLDQDGLDDLLFYGHDRGAVFTALNGQLEVIASFRGHSKQFQRYAHSFGTSLLPKRNEIVMQYGAVTYHLDAKGKEIEHYGERYQPGVLIFNDFSYDAASDSLFAASEIGGGNAIYRFDLSKPDWIKTKHTSVGRMAEVDQNMQQLYQQVLQFKLPTYQKPATTPWRMIASEPKDPRVQQLKGAELVFVKQRQWAESTDRGYMVAQFGKTALKRDKRAKYDMTRQQILAGVRKLEQEGTPFAFWAGHGSDPFIMQIETLEEIVRIAPNTCYGFVYAEMANPEDPRNIHFAQEYVPRLAKVIRETGSKAKLYFRYKGIFWGAAAHVSPWSEIFMSGKYADIMVPASEDTNSRTQEINLAGRAGMFANGTVDDWAMRLVDDNPTSWRPYSPGGQRSISPYLREGAIMAAYGARVGLIFPIKYLEQPGMDLMYALMASGVLPEVSPSDILSIGSWMLTDDIDLELMHRIESGHYVMHYQPSDTDASLATAQIHWNGVDLADYDISKAAYGVDYRWLNFIPKLPHGMVGILPDSAADKVKASEQPYFTTNLKQGLVNGKKVPAKAFGAYINRAVERGEKAMPVLVEGASWSAVRLDENHTRLIMIDPGYIDPQQRQVTVTFQGRTPKSATDILNHQALTIAGSQIHLTIPAGSLRFVDLAY